MKRVSSYIKAFLKGFPKWFGLYLGLTGLVTFNLFIMEEAFQTVMFGTWAAKDAKEWRLVKKATVTMEGMLATLTTMNYIGGWMNPFGFIAYKAYAQAEREYIDSLRAQVFANAPELFEGEIMTFTFVPGETEYDTDTIKMKNGQLIVWAREQKPVMTGKVKVEGDYVVVDAR